jgi:hypothetical protein
MQLSVLFDQGKVLSGMSKAHGEVENAKHRRRGIVGASTAQHTQQQNAWR